MNPTPTSLRQPFAALLLACALAGLGIACQSKPAAPPVSADAWAVVNGREITRDAVEKAFRINPPATAPASDEEATAAKLALLDELITEDLLVAKARELKIELPDTELDAAYVEARKNIPDETYQQELAKYKQQFQTAVSDFVKLYPQLVQDERLRLGTMYRPKDYPQPSDLFGMFDVSLDIAPVPDANDFRVDVAQETQDEIRAQITQSVADRQAKMVKDCWSRMREVVGRIAEQCGKEKGVIRDSLMDNARDLVAVLSGLNVTNDPEITAVENDIRDKLLVPTTRLRISPGARVQTAQIARELLERMPQE